MKIILATNNDGKLAEFSHLLPTINLNIVSQKEYAVSEIEETGLTFVENALLKARHASQTANLPAIADDSGFMVDALDGEPGLYSARYAGENASADENNTKLLNNLKNVSEAKRTARFYCCLVFIRHVNDPAPLIAEGFWEGKVLTAPTGKNGFGYDPVFYVPEKHCSAAELTTDEKNALSHRTKAVRQLLKLLQQMIKGVEA